MGIAFVSATQGGINGATLTLTWPIVPARAAALLLWTTQNTAGPTDPANFLLLEGRNHATGSGHVRFLRKVCTGAEGGTTLPLVTTGTAARQSATLVIYSGTHAGEPIDTWTWRDETGAVSTHPCPSISPFVSGGAIVSGVSERVNASTTNYTTTWTERADSAAAGSGSGGATTAMADDGLATPRTAGVSVTPPNWVSADPIATQNAGTLSVSLAPLVAVPPPPNPIRRRLPLLVR